MAPTPVIRERPELTVAPVARVEPVAPALSVVLPVVSAVRRVLTRSAVTVVLVAPVPMAAPVAMV
jgi:hypothetical protein